jgi:hypothetical protein
MYGKARLTEMEKARAKSAFSTLFPGINEIFLKEFVLAGQTVNSAYDCDVLLLLRGNVRRLRPELWRRKNWLLLARQRSGSHFPFAREFSPETTLFYISSIEDKTEKPPF